MSKKELRFCFAKPLQVEERAENGRKISGYAAVFNSFSEDLGGFREKIAPGAFAGCLTGDDIVALWSHNTDRVLGRMSNGTLQCTEDEFGLRFSLELDDTTDGLDCFKRVKRGDVKGCSFAFDVADDGDIWEYNEAGAPRLERTIVKFARCYEVSPTAFPAYPQTSVSARSTEELVQRAMKLVGPQVLPPPRRLLEIAKRKLQIASC